jgi:hypothetical protein
MQCNAPSRAPKKIKKSPELYKYAGQLIDSTWEKATLMRQ